MMIMRRYFCSMFGCIRTIPNEGTGDTHSLNYKEPYGMDEITRSLFSYSRVMCMQSLDVHLKVPHTITMK